MFQQNSARMASRQGQALQLPAEAACFADAPINRDKVFQPDQLPYNLSAKARSPAPWGTTACLSLRQKYPSLSQRRWKQKTSRGLSQAFAALTPLLGREQGILSLPSPLSFLLPVQQAPSLFSGGWCTQVAENRCCSFWRRAEKDLWIPSNISITEHTKEVFYHCDTDGRRWYHFLLIVFYSGVKGRVTKPF